MNIKMLAALAVIIAAAYGAWTLFASPGNANEEAIVVNIPEFTQVAQSGQIVFEDKCAACHGINAAGTEQGPTFLHAFYKAGHHGDASFESAAKLGARAHHWSFGDMPPVEGITDAEIRWVTKYVRELQAANGY
jgi:mono/diheme cytochrome c family protein